MGDFRRNASLLAWDVQHGLKTVIIQAALGMECVGIVEHELVCGERRARRAETRRAKKSREDTKSNEKTKGAFCKGCPWRHVYARGENDRF